jgi:hypothetical protein
MNEPRRPHAIAGRTDPGATADADADASRSDDALDPLRGCDDFRLLMMDLAFPADAFASAR